MDSYDKQSIMIGSDTYIEIHHNANISNKPYLFRICSYDGYTEHRFTEREILNLSEAIADFVFDHPNTTGYNDNFTGLARLWHHRRNEALEQLEKYHNE